MVGCYLRSTILRLATRLRGRHILIITITRLSLLRIQRFRAPIVAIIRVCDRRLVLGLRGWGLRCTVRIKVIVGVKGLELLKGVLRRFVSPVPMSVAQGRKCGILTGGEPLNSSPLMFEREGVGGKPRNW